jgi:hypothetical protein
MNSILYEVEMIIATPSIHHIGIKHLSEVK